MRAVAAVGGHKSKSCAHTKSRSDSGTPLHEPSGHAAIDATFFDRENASKHYCRRTNYRVHTLKTTALVDTETQPILDVHCTTGKPHDTQFAWQVARRNMGDLHSLAADKGYDWRKRRENLREEGVRPSSRRSSARSVTPCVRERGTVSFEHSC